MPRNDRCGIYAIEQIGTGRCYIGSSKAISSRWYQHRRLLAEGRHHSQFLQAAWMKHGEAAFRFFVIEDCDKSKLLELEQRYLDAFKPEFNVCKLARSRAGTKHRPEVLAHLRARAKELGALITHCPKGHEYDSANTYINAKGHRFCRKCNAERVSKVYASETPEQREARRKRTAHYAATNEVQRQKRAQYAAAHKAQKAAYDRARKQRMASMRKLADRSCLPTA